MRVLQRLAPDVKVEESNSELGQKEADSRPRGIGSRGEMTRVSGRCCVTDMGENQFLT